MLQKENKDNSKEMVKELERMFNDWLKMIIFNCCTSMNMFK